MKTQVFAFTKRHIVLLAVLTTFACGGCTKEDPDPQTPLIDYAKIKLPDIQAKNLALKTSGMIISDAGGIYFKAGDILFYKTSLGRYGKMKIINVDQADNYKLSFMATTYENNGAVFNESSAAIARGSWIFDLDQMEELEDASVNEDFWNERINPIDTHFVPKNDASFLRYTLP